LERLCFGNLEDAADVIGIETSAKELESRKRLRAMGHH
jgi:hypothetical protein